MLLWIVQLPFRMLGFAGRHAFRQIGKAATGDNKSAVEAGKAEGSWAGVLLALTAVPVATYAVAMTFGGLLAWAVLVFVVLPGGLYLAARRAAAAADGGTHFGVVAFVKRWKGLLSHDGEVGDEPSSANKRTFRFLTIAWGLLFAAAVTGFLRVAPELSIVYDLIPPKATALFWLLTPALGLAGHLVAAFVAVTAGKGHHEISEREALAKETWNLQLAKIFAVSANEWIIGGGEHKFNLDESVLTVVPAIGARGRTQSELESAVEKFAPGWTCTVVDFGEVTFEKVMAHPDVLSARAAKRDSGGLIVGYRDVPDTAVRRQAAIWLVNPAVRVTPEDVDRYAQAVGLSLVEWNFSAHEATVAVIGRASRQVRDRIAQQLSIPTHELELTVDTSGTAGEMDVVFLRFPAELDVARRDERYLTALRNLAPTDGIWRLVESAHGSMRAQLRPDRLAEIQTYPWDAEVGYRSIPFATGEDGAVISLGLLETNQLLGGIPGGGKSGGLTALLAGISRLENVAIIGLDPKRVEQSMWRPRFSGIAKEDDHASAVLEALVAEMERRYDWLDANGLKKLTPAQFSPERPMIVLVIDELADLVSVGTTREDKEAELNRSAMMRRIVAKGRAAGITVIAATQKPQSDVVPTALRDIIQLRVAYATTTIDMTDTILGKGMGANGGAAHEIPSGSKGVCFIVDETSRIPQHARTFWIPDEDVAGIAERTSHLRVELPWLPQSAAAGITKNWPAPAPHPPAPEVVTLPAVEFTLDDLEPQRPVIGEEFQFSFDD